MLVILVPCCVQCYMCTHRRKHTPYIQSTNPTRSNQNSLVLECSHTKLFPPQTYRRCFHLASQKPELNPADVTQTTIENIAADITGMASSGPVTQCFKQPQEMPCMPLCCSDSNFCCLASLDQQHACSRDRES